MNAIQSIWGSWKEYDNENDSHRMKWRRNTWRPFVPRSVLPKVNFDRDIMIKLENKISKLPEISLLGIPENV